jgi:hypothetical protein
MPDEVFANPPNISAKTGSRGGREVERDSKRDAKRPIIFALRLEYQVETMEIPRGQA